MVRLADCLRSRKLMRCIDIQQSVEAKIPRSDGEPHAKHQGRIALAVSKVEERLKQWQKDHAAEPERVLLDRSQPVAVQALRWVKYAVKPGVDSAAGPGSFRIWPSSRR